MLTPDTLRQTSNNKLAGILRIVVGVIFFLAGILKVTVPNLGAAFMGQLIAAGVPFHELVLSTFPFVEMSLGVLLVLGLHTRLAAGIAAVTMIVATYVHVVIDDPTLFPLQPVEPIGPIVLLIILAYMIWQGGGAWSVDLRTTNTSGRV